MKIHFLTTDLSMASGGAIYDKNFYEILKTIYPDTKLFNDKYFVEKYDDGSDLLAFNKYYKTSIAELMDCDYVIMNSRLYTRMMFFNIGRIKKKYPNTNFLVIHHHSNFMNNTGIRRVIHKFFEKRVLTSATELIIPNEYVVHQVKNDFSVDNIIFLPSSFEKKKYSISSLNSNIILFVGNVEYRKGIIYGIKAFKEIHDVYPNLEYHITGKYDKTDKYYIKLKNYIEHNGLSRSVIFEGRVSNERLNWLYENARLFLFPSLLEGYGWVMIEAMGRGVPVVAFNNSAMPYTVKNGYNGLLITNKDYHEMAEQIIITLNDEIKMKSLQNGALNTYKNVPSQDTLNELTEEYIRAWENTSES